MCGPVPAGKALEGRGCPWLCSVPGKPSTNPLGLHKLESYSHGAAKASVGTAACGPGRNPELGAAPRAAVRTRTLSDAKMNPFSSASTEPCSKAEHKAHTERVWENRWDLFFPALLLSLWVTVDVPDVV